jgi:hypothetical protein
MFCLGGFSLKCTTSNAASFLRELEEAFGEEAKRYGLGTCGSENGLIKDCYTKRLDLGGKH